jgi:exodeoxyribonuclease V alpha subunit
MFSSVDPVCSEWIKRLIVAAGEGHLCLEDPALPPIGVETDDPFPDSLLVRQGHRLYFQRAWAIESLVLHHWRRLSEPFHRPLGPFGAVTAAQEAAIRHAASYRCTLLTGGPGTGKTYTAAQFIRSVARPGMKIAIAAPTGRAASHLLGGLLKDGPLPDGVIVEATTLHRLLGLKPGQSRLKNPSIIDAHLIVVDEASMIEANLFAHLFAGVGTQASLLLIGDPHQLPPVGTPSFFHDLAQISSCPLNRSLRVEREDLLQFADAILKGEATWKTLLPWLYKGDPLELGDQWTLLSALKKNVDELNQRASFKRKSDHKPILLTSNDPSVDLYNGMVGILREKEAEFGDRIFPLHHLPSYEMAYALSIHKSQGSEYENVLIVLPEGSEKLGREALYTAVTRAKKGLKISCKQETWEKMVETRLQRKTGLYERITSLREH